MKPYDVIHETHLAALVQFLQVQDILLYLAEARIEPFRTFQNMDPSTTLFFYIAVKLRRNQIESQEHTYIFESADNEESTTMRVREAN